MRATVAVLGLLAASLAEAQTPPKPAIIKPVVKPAAGAPAKAAAPLETLKTELASVDAKLAGHEQAQKERDRLARSKGGVSGMSMDDMLAMQTLMERKSQLEKMISDTLKASSEPGQPLTKASRAS